jgi:cytochrome P450
MVDNLAPDHGWPDRAAIPHPRGRLPILGDLLASSLSTPVQNSMDHLRDLGPIFRRKVLSREVFVVGGADLAKDLLDETRFAKHVGLGVRNLRGVVGDGLFTAYNEEPNWQLAHDILMPGFTREAMESYHPTMLAMARKLTSTWDKHADAGKPVDVTTDMTKLTLETIANTGFGYDFGSFDRTETHPFVAAMVGALRYAFLTVIVPPALRPILLRRKTTEHVENVAYIRRAVDDVIKARLAANDARTNDLLGLMLNSAQATTGTKLDLANIRDQVLTFLIAGHETTSGALSFAMYYLAKNPDVLAKAQAEVDQVWGENPNPSYKDVSKLRYVRRVLDETLRFWPTAPAFSREARFDTTIGDGKYRLRKGAWAVLLIPALHRDPVWGADVDVFNPDRFAPEAVHARPGHVYRPFGTGARACIGRQFALHEAILVLGMLLHRYDLHDDANYQLVIAERLTMMPTGFTLTLSRRTPTGSDAVRRSEHSTVG